MKLWSAPSRANNRATRRWVCQAAAHIGRLAETYDLRVLDDPARCLEEVACSGNMDEIVQLMPDLVSAINRNRASFEEAERDG